MVAPTQEELTALVESLRRRVYGGGGHLTPSEALQEIDRLPPISATMLQEMRNEIEGRAEAWGDRS